MRDNTLYLVIFVLILTGIIILFAPDRAIKNQALDLSKTTITVFFAYKRGKDD